MSLRENLLTREIEDLKSKLMTKTDDLNEAIKSDSEVRMYSTCDVNNNKLHCVFLNNYGHYALTSCKTKMTRSMN